MGHGKGAFNKRAVQRVLKENGYTLVRSNGHDIYKGGDGSTISIPRTYCTFIITRLFKENNIEIPGDWRN